MLTTFAAAVAVLVLLYVMMGVKIVRQGYRYTIEHFGPSSGWLSRGSIT